MHVPVLLEESISALSIKKDGVYVDATLGRGGHSYHILTRLSSSGQLFGFDADSDAIETSRQLPPFSSPQVQLIHANYASLKEELAKFGINQVDGILFDLGVSSPQLDTSERGFSFQRLGRLDMRMDQRQNLSCYEVINSYPEIKLADIIFKYGEERYAKLIAKGIVEARKGGYITTTTQLSDIIRKSVPIKYVKETHPARRTFQALRIHVNDELENLQKGLDQALDLLKPGGRLAVISFHSLEDRIVKQTFQNLTKPAPWNRNMPLVIEKNTINYRLVNKKVILPTRSELNDNPRSSSAKLRIIERIR